MGALRAWWAESKQVLLISLALGAGNAGKDLLRELLEPKKPEPLQPPRCFHCPKCQTRIFPRTPRCLDCCAAFVWIEKAKKAATG